MTGKWDVDDWIDEIAALKVKRFYPTAVAKDTSLPLKEVFQYLLEAVKEGKLNLLWEIRCPNLECVRSIMFSPEKMVSGEITCPVCGELIEITPDIVFPVFEVTNAYKERMTQKKNKKTRIAFSMARAYKASHCH